MPPPAPLTPAAGATPYCTVAEFLAFADARRVGQLVRDDAVQLNAAALTLDAVLAIHLAAASGEVELACTKGGRYQPADLAALGGNGHAVLARTVANLAFDSIVSRRGYEGGKPPAAVLDARATLAALARGDEVFPFQEIEAAGNPASRFRTPAEILQAGLPGNSYPAVRFMGPPRGGAYTRYNGFGPGYGGGYGGGGW